MNKRKSSSILSAFKGLLGSTIGRIKWTSPPWVKYLRHRSQSHPTLFWSLTGALILFIGVGIGTYIWYSHLPKPQLVTAKITPPKVTPIEANEDEKPIPDNLTIDFGLANETNEDFEQKSVAPLDLVGKDVQQGVDISPKIDGRWYWSSDSQLLFEPKEDWAAGQTYTIHFNNDFFAKTNPLGAYKYSFSTQPLSASIKDFSFYQDPINPKLRQAVATLTFNFPIDPQSLENETNLLLATLKDGKLDNNGKPYKFTFTFDKNYRIAYLRSEPVQITNVPKYLQLQIKEGVKSATGSDYLKTGISQTLLIPDSNNYLKIKAITGTIVRNDQDRPEQILAVESTLGVTETELKKHIHVYLLPKDYPATAKEEEKKDYEWQNPGEVTPDIVSLSTPVPLEAIPGETHYANLHSYKISAQTPRYVYVKVDKGLRGLDNFKLNHEFATVIKVPEYPKEISFLHKGALLSLGGEKKLSVLVRGLPAVKFNFARILPGDINQLVTQTQGDFNNPYFINSSFNQHNISEVFSEVQQFNSTDNKQQYTALDFDKYLSNIANSGGPQGLFLLQARGWDAEKNEALDAITNRLILITDLALIVKDNQDGSHDVFVQSISQGTAMANINVSVLGKNGLPVMNALTNIEGRASFPSLKDYVEEREPVVYLASLGNDVSFIPYNNNNRQLNFSRYDVGGLYTTNQELNSLSAYLFSDRGIYRPGDKVHLGIILKQAYAKPQPPGLTVELTITDPRGTTIQDKKFTVDELGYLTYDFSTLDTSPTGQYYINLFLVKDDHSQHYLGSLNIRVAEFQPDRMRIQSTFSKNNKQGWVSPEGLSAKVNLRNLYGAPAANRKISSKILLEPKRVEFTQYPDYVFFDPLVDPKKPAKIFTDTLKEEKTNGQGETVVNLNLQRFAKATYQLTFFAEGFEAEGGRSVTTQSQTLVSPLPFFIGYKADGDLHFIKQNSQRSIHYLAVDPSLTPKEISGLKIQLVALQPVSTLVKNANGTYQYQSIVQSKILKTEPIAFSKGGLHFNLPTENIGDYALNIVDENNIEVSQLKFSIVGDSQRPLSRNAELDLKLNKEEYRSGEDIELQITAPYTGTGLITVEREKVYASKWFKTDSTSSVQTIHIPEDFQGNGYVNVAFVRDWNSPEIFINPLSYSIAPFSVDSESHTVHINLNTPAQAKPGDNFPMEYSTDKPGKIILFAVDEGILQVAKYTLPEPIAFFFQKRALEVITQQTVDQILPKYIRERELSSVGGDGGEDMLSHYLNPFKRKTDLPIAFWSGLLDTDTTPRKVSYSIPDYFNGTLHVMAVAVSLDSVGSAEKKAEVRGDFIINPNVPTFVAPGDEFEITASVANNLSKSNDSPIEVMLEASPEIQIIGSDKMAVTIPEGKEEVVRYRLRALNNLGSATLTFTARKENATASIISSLSVRPATIFSTLVEGGSSTEEKKTIGISRDMYPEFKQVEAAVSTDPIILASGLQRYLDNFPYGCTEQLVSKAFPLLVLKDQSWLVDNPQTIDEKIQQTLSLLGFRQMTSGGFSYWPGLNDHESNQFISIYAMHFLLEADAAGYVVTEQLYNAGLDYLTQIATSNPTNLNMARDQAYAIYILTRNEIVTSNYLTTLILYLDKQSPEWKKEITGSFIASTFKLLKNDKEAQQLINSYNTGTQGKTDNQDLLYSDFYAQKTTNAMYLYLIANHFPETLAKRGESLVDNISSTLNNDEINTIFSSYAILGLGSYDRGEKTNANTVGIVEKLKDNSEKTLPSDPKGSLATLDPDSSAVTFSNPQKDTYFYQVTQAGFDKAIPKESLAQGIEVFREYRDKNGNVLTELNLGDEIEVHIQIRGLTDNYLSNIVIIDPLPGGFEVVQESINNQTVYVDYFDIREDRVVFFSTLEPNSKEIVYKIKATTSGKFVVPAIYAEAMYNPKVRAHGIGGMITVSYEAK